VPVISGKQQLRHLLPMLAAALVALSPPVAAQDQSASAPEAQQPQERLDVWEIRVLGNTVLPAVQIERTIYPFLGRARSMAEIEQARLSLEKAYKDAGYGTVLVDVPEQDVVDGLVRFQVTEGRLDRVRVTGARYFANRRIRAALPALAKDSVPYFPALQDQLTKVNRQSADRVVTPVLRAGREPGLIDMELKVADELPVHAEVEASNRYTANTSETRLAATLSYDNLWQRYHSLSFQYQTAPEEPDETRVLAATYVAPLEGSGHILAGYVVDTDSEFTTLGGDFTSLGVIGKGQIYGLRYIVPLPPGERYSHSFSFGGDYKDFGELILQPDGTAASTPISYLNWSGTYTAHLRTEHTASSFDLGASFGIRGLANDSHEFYFKRFSGTPNKGEPSYFYLRGAATHERPLLLGLTAYARLAGQYSVQALISNEQFSIGGADSVRGYLESEALGDYGASGNLEIRLPLPRGWLADQLEKLYVFGFADAGVVAIQHALDQQERRTDLSSWGAGLRIAAFGGLEADLDWATALRDSQHTEAGDSRIHFRVRYGF
jgi:hemolysin activation/secretion protein